MNFICAFVTKRIEEEDWSKYTGGGNPLGIMCVWECVYIHIYMRVYLKKKMELSFWQLLFKLISLWLWKQLL